MNINTKKAIEVKVILNESKYGIGFSKHKKGKYYGFGFYEIIKDNISLITVQINNKPEIEAITKEQYLSWKNKHIIAMPEIITIS